MLFCCLLFLKGHAENSNYLSKICHILKCSSNCYWNVRWIITESVKQVLSQKLPCLDFFPPVCHRRAVLISSKHIILFDRCTTLLNLSLRHWVMFFGQVLPFDSPVSIGLCSSVEVLTLPLGPLESAGRGKFIVVIAPLCAGDCCLPGTWSVSWQGVKKPLDTCPAYLNCGAWVIARGRHIYSLNILL